MDKEYIEIYTKCGEPTGEKLLKSKIHKEGLFHATVHVWMFCSKDKILIQKRSKNKEINPGVWDVSVAGHIRFNENKIDHIKPKRMDIDIVHEDEEIIIVNKPSGLTVHPGAGNKENTLVNGLLHLYKNNLSTLNGPVRPGIVHRIDKETSGLLVVAKNNFSHASLSKQFSDHSIERKYLALLWGVIRPLNGKIVTLLSRSKKNRKLMSVSEISGKKAITNYKTLKVFYNKEIPKISLVECILETGRTHQIRVHFSYKGNSLIGDKTYGRKKLQFKKINKKFQKILADFDRQALHAKSLGFFHPTKNTFVSFDSKLPQDFKKMLDFLEKFGN